LPRWQRTEVLPPDFVRAECEAQSISEEFWIQSPAEIDLQLICWSYKLLVVEGPIQAADAWLIDAGDHGIARVRENLLFEGQKRFAIAHELGHWRMHRGVSLTHFDTPEQLTDYKRSPVEVEANAFASALLMPESLFMQPSLESPGFSVLNDLAREFCVGPTAAARRFIRLTEQDCMLVAHKDGLAAWFAKSQTCSIPEVWPRSPVPQAVKFPCEAPDLAPRQARWQDWFTGLTRSGPLLEDSIAIPEAPNLTLLIAQ
jgi:IrrE N-terminal-like domain